MSTKTQNIQAVLKRRLALVVVFALMVLLAGQLPGLAQEGETSDAAAETEAASVIVTEVPTDAPTEVQPTELPTEVIVTEAPTEVVITEAPTEPPTEVVTTEAPTEPPTDVVTTEAPTDTATEPATPEVTDTVTDMPTATAELTEAPTETAQPTEATAEPTTPSPTYEVPTLPEPALAVLFNETFDAGSLAAWRLGAGWALAPAENGQGIQTATTAALQYASSELWNVAVQARFASATGTAGVLLRQSSGGVYSAAVSPEGRVELARSGQVMQTASVTLSSGWHTLRFSVMDNALRVAVDGVEVIALVDPEPLPAGAVTLVGVIPAEGQTLIFDDVFIWQPESEIAPTATPTLAPTATLPVEITPEVTVEPTVEITPEITPTVDRIIVVPTLVTSTPTPESTAEQPSASALVAPRLVSPANNSRTTGTRPTFTWQAVPGAVSYRVRLYPATGAAFSVGTVTTTSYRPPSPLLYRVYAWQVQAVNASNTASPWSSLYRVTIYSGSSAAPVPNRSTSRQVVLSWTPISWATLYHIQLDNNIDFSSPVTNIGNIPPSQLSLTTRSLNDGTYYWRVRAQRGSTWGGWSAVGTFTVETSSP